MGAMTKEERERRTYGANRKASFVLAASNHGTMIVNRLDFLLDRPGYAVGVGCEILENSQYEMREIDLIIGLLELRREYNGPGVIAIDGGANIGVHTIEMAKAMSNYGQVVAIEPQERIFYALAGNIVINNCHNACAIQAGLAEKAGMAEMPVPDYTRPASYGGCELRPPPVGGMVSTGQVTADRAPVRLMRIDDLDLNRIDLIKLDLEGMEVAALEGGAEAIQEHHPLLVVEHIKSGIENITAILKPWGYEAFQFEGNLFCAHRLDKCLDHIRHLFQHLMREQAGVDENFEWLKFSRPEAA